MWTNAMGQKKKKQRTNQDKSIMQFILKYQAYFRDARPKPALQTAHVHFDFSGNEIILELNFFWVSLAFFQYNVLLLPSSPSCFSSIIFTFFFHLHLLCFLLILLFLLHLLLHLHLYCHLTFLHQCSSSEEKEDFLFFSFSIFNLHLLHLHHRLLCDLHLLCLHLLHIPCHLFLLLILPIDWLFLFDFFLFRTDPSAFSIFLSSILL